MTPMGRSEATRESQTVQALQDMAVVNKKSRQKHAFLGLD